MVKSKRPKTALKAVLNISKLPVKSLVAATQAIVDTAATSPALTSSKPIQQAQQGLAVATSNLQTSLSAHDTSKKTWQAAEQQLLADQTAVINAANTYRDLVNATPNLDAQTINSLGLKVQGQKTASKAMSFPLDIVVKPGKQPGELDVKWKRVAGAKTYLIQVTEDPNGVTGWVDANAVTKSKVSLPGLTSGKRAWVRVASVGSSGTSAYSAASAASVP